MKRTKFISLLMALALAATACGGSSDTPPDELPFTDASGYGSNGALDLLWDGCEAGDGDDCDDLFWSAPGGSAYEAFGLSCGERVAADDRPASCVSATGDDDGDRGADGDMGDGDDSLVDDDMGDDMGDGDDISDRSDDDMAGDDGASFSGEVAGYGDDPTLDALWDECAASNGPACDELFWTSPSDSEYEEFGLSCGGLYLGDDRPLECGDDSEGSAGLGDAPMFYGDNAELDWLWDSCETGNGVSCDTLFWESPGDSAYEEFGNTCGGRFDIDDVPFSCEEAIGGADEDSSSAAGSYGDDAGFDALWDACEAGDGASCDELFWESPGDSAYEEFGNTCGGRFDIDDVPFSCEDAI